MQDVRINVIIVSMKGNAQKIDAMVIQIITKVVVIDCEKIVRSSSI